MSEPFTPAGCDLRDFPFMPVDITRLFGSEFHAASDDAAWRAGMTLWLKSYHQVPAASIPDDDVALARLAEFGRDAKGWRKVKAAALRGWCRCDDGRLYHPVVAEKALEAWVQKILQRKATGAATAKRLGSTFDPSPFDQQIADVLDRLQRLSPGSRILAKRLRRIGQTAPDGSPGDDPSGRSDGFPCGRPPGRPPGQPGALQVEVQETGTGTETGNKREGGGKNAADPPPPANDSSPPTSGDPPVKRRRGRSPKADTELPPDFALTPELAAHARKAGYDPPSLFERFRDKALAKGWTYRDWSAAFRTFVAMEQRYAPPLARPNGAHRPPDC